MARSIKTRGASELMSLKRRVIRQYALGRIYKTDHDRLIGDIDKLEAYIVNMRELNEQGQEEG